MLGLYLQWKQEVKMFTVGSGVTVKRDDGSAEVNIKENSDLEDLRLAEHLRKCWVT